MDLERLLRAYVRAERADDPSATTLGALKLLRYHLGKSFVLYECVEDPKLPLVKVWIGDNLGAASVQPQRRLSTRSFTILHCRQAEAAGGGLAACLGAGGASALLPLQLAGGAVPAHPAQASHRHLEVKVLPGLGLRPAASA